MTIEEKIIKMVNAEKESLVTGITAEKVLEGISPFIAAINLPLGVTVGLSAMVYSVISESRELSTTPISDDWLALVSSSDAVTATGLNFLEKKLKTNGIVSVTDALKFIDIESKSGKESSRKWNDFGNGALSIIERAKNLRVK